MNPDRVLSLNGSDWGFKGYTGEDWLWRNAHTPDTRDRRGWRQAVVPGSVQHDLWQAGAIPDPYFEQNSLLVEWAPQRTWVYKKAFTVDPGLQGKRIQLCFKGVDYEAQFFLNGEQLGEHRGMFTPALFEVDQLLHYGEENLLSVVIQPAPPEQPQVGRTSKVRTHKARMNYWWDFCPRMVHLGIWDEVFLKASGPVRIADVFVRPELSEDYRQARLSVSIALSCLLSETALVEIAVRKNGQLVANQKNRHLIESGSTLVNADLVIQQPELWWPNGHGGQPLYEADVQVWAGDEANAAPSDQEQVTFGIRTLRFTPNETPDPSARPYTLTVNGERIYAKGWNWVPMDVLYGVEQPEKLARLLELARRANANLLRVWGGGLIEKDSFYDLCDRLGILVWQEFIQSSSGIDNNPSNDPVFIEMMVQEARQIVPRKRNHPSLAIWCGGNELQTGPEKPASDDHPLLSALKEVVTGLDPDRLWLPTSSSGRVFSNSLENIAHDPLALHDVHGPWEHQGLVEQFTLYNQGSSLLHSEFGIEGITNLGTLNRVMAKDHQLPVSLDNPYWEHLGAWWVKEASWREMLGEISDLEVLVQAVQFLQADGLRYAVEADRRRKYRNSGTLPWQFNEPYPMAACTSAVDYHANPKPAYFAVAHVYEPVHVSARFARQAWEGERQFQAEIWVSSSLRAPCPEARLEITLAGAGGRVYASTAEPVSFGANESARLSNIQLDLASLDEAIFFLDLRLSRVDGVELSHNRYVFSRTSNLNPLLHLEATALEAEVEELGDRWILHVKNIGPRTALYLWIINSNDLNNKNLNNNDRQPGSPGYVYFSDNHFCLFPGERRSIALDWVDAPENERRILLQGWNTAPVRLPLP